MMKLRLVGAREAPARPARARPRWRVNGEPVELHTYTADELAALAARGVNPCDVQEVRPGLFAALRPVG